MAGSGYRDWAAGNIPTAAQFDTYLQEQTVMVFATTAARDSALTTAKAEGMVTYQLDTNTFTWYSGSAWSTWGPASGALTTWTPTVTQSGAVTVTVNYATYQRRGREVTCRFSVSATGAGTANNAVTIGGLPFTSAHTSLPIGIGYLSDASVPFVYAGMTFWLETSTTLNLLGTTNNANPRAGITGSGTFAAALASGDIIGGTFTYEAAADA